MINGIDVSSVQGHIDFEAVAATGVQFVFAKCYTGNDGGDPTYQANVANATAAGLKVGSYHFLYPIPTNQAHPNRDPAGQAQLHFQHCQTEVVAADLEWPAEQDWAKWGINANFINDWTLQYLQTYEQLSGRKPLLYTYPYFAKVLNLPAEFANYQLWLANYSANISVPAPWSDWEIVQTSGGSTHLPNGVPVDTDIMKSLDLWG